MEENEMDEMIEVLDWKIEEAKKVLAELRRRRREAIKAGRR